jgi:hypothetical protein
MVQPTIRKGILLAIGFFLLQILSGQVRNRPDSLLRILRVTHDDHFRARLFLEISKEEELRDPVKALQYARQALQLSQISGFDSAEVRALVAMGMNYNRAK